jgi:hypothetical protein
MFQLNSQQAMTAMMFVFEGVLLAAIVGTNINEIVVINL